MTILGILGGLYLGYLLGYELAWDDRANNKIHRLRKIAK